MIKLYIMENNKTILPMDDEMAIKLYPKYKIYYEKKLYLNILLN